MKDFIFVLWKQEYQNMTDENLRSWALDIARIGNINFSA